MWIWRGNSFLQYWCTLHTWQEPIPNATWLLQGTVCLKNVSEKEWILNFFISFHHLAAGKSVLIDKTGSIFHNHYSLPTFLGLSTTSSNWSLGICRIHYWSLTLFSKNLNNCVSHVLLFWLIIRSQKIRTTNIQNHNIMMSFWPSMFMHLKFYIK